MRFHRPILWQTFALEAIAASGGEQQRLKPLAQATAEDNASLVPEGVVAPDLQDYVGAVMRDWHVPGMAIAVVDGNKTWSKGFGHAILPDTPATPHTLFYTGSTTKSMTAAALSLLIDNATTYADIAWTTPISRLLREDFVLSDAWATDHITVEDALSHRTGYPRHDLATVAVTVATTQTKTGSTARDGVRNLRNLPMSAEPRAAFQYCNRMYGVAGYLVETLTGLSLGDFFHRHLWGPMGMDETFLGLRDVARSNHGRDGLLLADEYYYHYHNGSKRHIALPHTDVSDIEGAGSTAISTVLDYAKYLRAMMAAESESESAGGGPVLSRAGHRELKRPRIVASGFPNPPFAGYVSYALGWFCAVFGAEQAYWHTGQTGMFVSTMIMVPSRQFGIVVFQNSDPPAHQMVAYRVLYDLFAVPQAERFDFDAQFKAEQQVYQHSLATCAGRIYPSLPEPPLLPTLPLASYVGNYREAGYGNVTVSLDCDDDESGNGGVVQLTTGRSGEEKCPQQRLRIGLGKRFGALSLVVDLEHMSGDFWLGRSSIEEIGADAVLACTPVQFRVDASGAVAQLGIDARQEGEGGPLVWFEWVEG